MEDVEKIVRIAKQVMLDVGEHGPTVAYKGSKGLKVAALAEFGSTADERIRDMANAGVLAAIRHNVGELEMVIFVSEAWMGRRVKEGEDMILPSLDPKRIEVLMITYLDAATKEQGMIAFEIVRNKQQKVIDLKNVDLPKVGEAKGELLSAFQKGYQLVRPTTN